MKLIITTPEFVSWEYTLPPGAEQLLAQVASGEMDRIMLIEQEPEIRRGFPMRFEIRR